MAVIGAGGIAGFHASGVAAANGATLAATCDLDAAKAKQLAENNGAASWYTDIDELIKNEALDAAIICTNHGSHHPLVLKCAEAGIHVLVEKPLSVKLSEAEDMVRVAREANIHFGAVFQRRFQPAAERMKAAIDDGRIGPVTLLESFCYLDRDEAYYNIADWRGTWAGEGGGVLMTQAIHMLDMAYWLAGKPVEVYGRWDTLKHSDYAEIEDTVVATVEFESGALGTITACTTLHPQFGFSTVVRGRNGASVGFVEEPELSEARTNIWTLEDEPDPREPWEIAGEERPGMPKFHHVQIQEFVDAVIADRPPAVTGEQALVSLQMAKAVYLSQYRKAPVKLPLTSADIEELESKAERRQP